MRDVILSNDTASLRPSRLSTYILESLRRGRQARKQGFGRDTSPRPARARPTAGVQGGAAERTSAPCSTAAAPSCRARGAVVSTGPLESKRQRRQSKAQVATAWLVAPRAGASLNRRAVTPPRQARQSETGPSAERCLTPPALAEKLARARRAAPAVLTRRAAPTQHWQPLGSARGVAGRPSAPRALHAPRQRGPPVKLRRCRQNWFEPVQRALGGRVQPLLRPLLRP